MFNRVPGRLHTIKEHLWAYSDAFFIGSSGKVLFVDAGANIGQGYFWFSRHFDKENISFELFEPNPNCYKKLLDLVPLNVCVQNVGIGPKEGVFNFYGLAECEGGGLSVGGSIIPNHNSARYSSTQENAIEVQIIDFSKYLKEKTKNLMQL